MPLLQLCGRADLPHPIATVFMPQCQEQKAVKRTDLLTADHA
jgi:hypothetical protein